MEPMLQFFEYVHLPGHLADVSRPFRSLAHDLCATLPRNPERTVALRKLLEAKDCAVRAYLYVNQEQGS
jgi:ferritin-like protein